MYRIGSNKHPLALGSVLQMGLLITSILCLPSTRLLAQQKPDAPNQSQEALKVALGGSSAMSAFSACGYIGTMADAYAAGIYKEKQLTVRMGGLIGGLKMNKSQLEQLGQSPDLDEGDLKMLSDLVEILDQLITEADSLRKYVTTRKAQHLKAFHESRTKSWDLTAALLGLNKEFAMKLAPGGAKLGK